jgi:hypothetical protein
MFGEWALRNADRSGTAIGSGWRLVQGGFGDK